MFGRLALRLGRNISANCRSLASTSNVGTMLPADGRRLGDLMPSEEGSSVSSGVCAAPYAPAPSGSGRRVYLETYGCQMNVSDTEIVRAVLSEAQFQEAKRLQEADVVLLMTCAIREGAEQKIRERIKALGKTRRKGRKGPPAIGVLGCMAERLKTRLLEEEPLISLIAGPDAYRDLPRLLSNIQNPADAINVLLSLDETYADIQPMRRQTDSVSAFLSIMRGCDNMCTYCIVPFTRGRERSRPIDSILDNARSLAAEGVKEMTLLGQNVNSYRDLSVSTHYGSAPSATKAETSLPGFSTVYKPKMGGRRFVDLLEAVSSAVPDVRIRFTSPHPKDFPIEVLELMRERSNLCKQLHLPAQSGDNAVLAAMGRGYTRDTYLELVQRVRSILGQEVCLTSDFIAGFCGETEAAHKATLDLMRKVRYDFTYCFAYSMREKTRAHRRLVDDVEAEVKKRRASELITAFREEALALHTALIGSTQVVLVTGPSKRLASQSRAHRRLVDDVEPEVKKRRASELITAFREEALALHTALIGSTQVVLVTGPSKRLASQSRAHRRLVDDVEPEVKKRRASELITAFREEALALHTALIGSTQVVLVTGPSKRLASQSRAHRRLVDDVEPEVKKRRASELITAFREEALALHTALIGSTQVVLVTGPSKRSSLEMEGRSDGGTKVIFPKDFENQELRPGDYVAVKVKSCSSQVLKGRPLYLTSLSEGIQSQDSCHAQAI